MSWLKSRTFGAHVALSLVAGFVVGVSAEVLADTVYTWTTDDGTVSFTDDEKHVPARYRDRVQTKVMDGLDGYYRYTPVDVAAGPPDATASAAATPAPSVAPGVVVVPDSGISVVTGGNRYGSGGMIVPIDAAPGEEPVVVESRRVKRDDSMATTHETVIRQGDRVLSVRRNESSHRDGTSMVPPLD